MNGLIEIEYIVGRSARKLASRLCRRVPHHQVGRMEGWGGLPGWTKVLLGTYRNGCKSQKACVIMDGASQNT